ncbi:regulator of microtubule dynamics protein 2 [Sinocyclocheilus grahami]|uniref:regulator of microtubule dynamics protein 2 n=1 Tax=Sinocyclocheilus grahami TaxID=75366 RepID=UPI0007AC89B1|nr:PREDICTED: regulator of microtubule dynamics protein 2-like [Sinocyclocheilus grahami]
MSFTVTAESIRLTDTALMCIFCCWYVRPLTCSTYSLPSIIAWRGDKEAIDSYGPAANGNAFYIVSCDIMGALGKTHFKHVVLPELPERYITALADSEEEESDDDRKPLQEPVDELTALLRKADRLHSCNGAEKAQGLNALLERKAEFDQKCQYLWRLSRAYADAHDFAVDLAEKKSCAENGKKVGEEAISFNPQCAEGHQWYAILCGLLSEYESIQNKIKNGYLFKDHLDKAIELKPEDPLSYYLLGRWCYAVSQCTWIERKIAATLFGEPPSATVQDALQNFLKVEEISPKYSKFNYVFLAKCYKDLGQRSQAQQMCDAASAMNIQTKEDEEAQKELDSFVASL